MASLNERGEQQRYARRSDSRRFYKLPAVLFRWVQVLSTRYRWLEDLRKNLDGVPE